MAPRKSKLIAYARVSTQEQADSGLGIAAQLAAIEDEFGTPDEVYIDEGVSGASLPKKRKGLSAAIATLKRGDRLVMRDVSRLSRWFDLTFWLKMELEQFKKVSLLDCEGDLQGDAIILQAKAMAAAQTREAIQRDTKQALAVKKAKGEKTGGTVPYGYDVDADGQLTDNVEEQQTIAAIKELRGRGWTLQAICDEMAARGIATKTGKTTWQPKNVSRLLKAA